MKIEDIRSGQTVVIGWRYQSIGLGGVTCTVVAIRPAPDDPDDNPNYPHGMVQVQLPDDCGYPARQPWIGPEDLAPPLPIKQRRPDGR